MEMVRTHKNVIKRFVTQLYGVYEEEITTVDAASLYLFQHKGSDFEHMPPSSDALYQHFFRVACIPTSGSDHATLCFALYLRG